MCIRDRFKRLREAGRVVELAPGTRLTEERVVCDQLFFLLDGAAAMSLNGAHITTIVRGGFANTLAVQQGGWQPGHGGVPSYGTITAHEPTTAIVWDLAKLGELLRADKELQRRMDHVLVASLMRRLLRSCLLYTSPSPRDATLSRMPSSA